MSFSFFQKLKKDNQMLKRSISYEDFNGQQVTEIFYFNLSEAELVEMEVDVEGGLGEMLQRIVAERDAKALVSEFKKLILASYGQKSADGKRFIKNNDIREEFSQTAAYQALFVELATDGDAAGEFVKGVMPARMSVNIPDNVLETVASETPPPLPEV